MLEPLFFSFYSQEKTFYHCSSCVCEIFSNPWISQSFYWSFDHFEGLFSVFCCIYQMNHAKCKNSSHACLFHCMNIWPGLFKQLPKTCEPWIHAVNHHGSDTNIPACTADWAGTVLSDCWPRITAFDRAIMVNGIVLLLPGDGTFSGLD